jgi:hypothetical protein
MSADSLLTTVLRALSQRTGNAAPGVSTIRKRINLMQVSGAVDIIPVGARIVAEAPALIREDGFNDADRDRLFKALEFPADQDSTGPWAGQRDIEMVAIGFSLETAPSESANCRRSAGPAGFLNPLRQH